MHMQMLATTHSTHVQHKICGHVADFIRKLRVLQQDLLHLNQTNHTEVIKGLSICVFFANACV